MAKILAAYFNSAASKDRYRLRLESIGRFLTNEFATDHSIKYIESSNVFIVIVGFNESLDISEDQGLLGFSNTGKWYDEAVYPDGNFFIYRKSQGSLELISDLAGTRSIWYYKADEFFSFSSMQIPLILLKGDFNFNSKVVPWMISSGSLGPGYSWDKELSLLPRNTSLKFHLTTREICITKITRLSVSSISNKKSLLKKFNEILSESISSLNISPQHTVHLLSGGLESRLLLIFLAIPKKLKCVTWGSIEAINSKKSDVGIAKRLTDRFKLDHDIYTLDEPALKPQFILDEFLKYGEGRVDHMYGYLDGFKLWKSFARKNIHTVIRGDHNFGRYKSPSEKMVRKAIGCEFISDVEDKILIEARILQNVPDWLLKEKYESNLDYADRIGIDFRHPYINSALNDLKHCFVEVNNPLMNNRLVGFSFSIPNNFSQEKKVTRDINGRFIREISYAKPHSSESLNSVLSGRFKGVLLEILKGATKEDLADICLDEMFIQGIIKGIESKSATHHDRGVSNFIKKLIPKRLKKRGTAFKRNKVPEIRLAFRVVMLLNMARKIRGIMRNNT
ncbi:hypothetical protein [Echinicola rosea]|uniref:Asparagine synthetase domain-containing protein n=1 Tax=Echinicola rosea TaxID=1807691 RepID=A0ABQ1V9P3_9BACT|nr:hypothetical protein [Echinicola rosea]GGF46923.1 hypothetical protein GCM10011339_39350 [Echinicola rosea]